MDTLMTETEFLLHEARLIACRQVPDASEVLVAEVFRRLCREADTSREERAAAGGMAH
ncbi:hypothetical protein [Bordetella hinzii]|uniref:hypothetical protein n=1 Tax=Bordetella hinzii TaxID=103855 RepID=UPI000A8987A7|nr:hypothetical protein [Bordetella hinzii]VEH23192.1 Uncharacterised protein [Bordetella hinzii]